MAQATQPPKDDPSHVDVLIVGAGPAGLMIALWMARLGIHTRIVDKRGTKIFNGQADGLQCRTLEIFDSFDFGHRAWRESNHMLEINLWNPDNEGKIVRSDKIPDTILGISHWQQVVLHQGRIERFYLDQIKEYSAGSLEVERGVLPSSLDFDASKAEDSTAYPIHIRLRHLSEDEATPAQTATSANGAALQDGLFRSNLTGDDTQDLLLSAANLGSKAGKTEDVYAKYVVGCDGAHSWVRNQLGFKLRGESTDYIWGVLDVIPITDFPDIRMRCAIHSARSGSLMVIPREKKLVRLYIQLTTTDDRTGGGGKVDRSNINPEVILASAQRIIHPYKLTYRYCDWWTAYQIGQRVGDEFSSHERIFLAGDAVHTHSPKAGQGMNVSMQDTYNLGWKLGAVINGYADRKLLRTYQSERRRVAQDLIDFDHKFSRLFSGRPAKDVMDEEGISMVEFKEAFEKGNEFASGVAVDYGKSLIVAKEGSSADQGDGTDISGSGKPAKSTPSLAANIQLGKRMPSTKVLNQSDARPWHFHDLLKSTGQWRIAVFAGDILSGSVGPRLNALGDKLNAPDSFIRRYSKPTAAIDSLISCLIVHASPRKETAIFDCPLIFRPFSPTEGWDYSKIHVDDESYHEGHGEAYKTFGIDPKQGCALILRPDQYVSWIGAFDDYENMERFFAGFMREREGGPNEVGIDLPEGALEYELERADSVVQNGAGEAATEGLVEGAM